MPENDKNKKIYIVFSATPYKTGKVIRFVTRTKYNHVSFALEESLDVLYAYSRYYENTTFYGGFTEEALLRYQCKKNDSQIMVCALPLTDKQYDMLINKLEEIKAEREEYIYNFFSMFVAPFGKSVALDKSYTCIEFVCMMLKYLGIYKGNNMSPSFDYFDAILRKYMIFEGYSRDYHKAESWGPDPFPERKTRRFYFSGMKKNTKKLIKKYRNRPRA